MIVTLWLTYCACVCGVYYVHTHARTRIHSYTHLYTHTRACVEPKAATATPAYDVLM